MNGFLIAGTASGVGKTTVTLALIAAMRQRGSVVQPFKGGPDFLDTGHHTRFAGRNARNLDTWMLSRAANELVFREASVGADVVIVEGMMGLFDGKDGATEIGSSAEIAKLLSLPVVLILDAAKSARSIAAVVLGFERFDPQLPLAGVILNKVANERHFKMLEEAIACSCQTPVLVGCLATPRLPFLRDIWVCTPLRNSNDPESLERQIDTLALLAKGHLNLGVLSSLQCGFDFGDTSPQSPPVCKPSIRIGVARDEAFSFYYQDNLDLLRQHGGEIVSFSPLRDAALPGDLDALYLGGGYPELHALQLSTNHSMLQSIQMFAASDRPIYAECGGMIYLSQQLITGEGIPHAMAAILPFSMEMTGKLAKFGYVTVDLTRDCLLGARGTVLRGHSFHYSRITAAPDLPTSYRVTYSLSVQQEDEGFSLDNILASYIHLHFGSAPDIARYFVEFAIS